MRLGREGQRKGGGAGRSRRRRMRDVPRWCRFRRLVRRHRLEIAFAAPMVAYVLVLTLAPIADTVRLALTGPEGALPSAENFRAIFGDSVFRSAIGNTVVVA